MINWYFMVHGLHKDRANKKTVYIDGLLQKMIDGAKYYPSATRLNSVTVTPPALLR